jgi:hydroxylaminobenzene mutase
MEALDESTRQGHRLLQAGILLFLLALIAGLLVHKFTVPRLGLSVHLLGIMQGIFLMLIGSLWPKLNLARAPARMGFWLAVYGCYSAWTANLLAGVWGAGNPMLPFAAGMARGSEAQEAIISIALRSAALSLIATALLVLWGLRTSGSNQVTK